MFSKYQRNLYKIIITAKKSNYRKESSDKLEISLKWILAQSNLSSLLHYHRLIPLIYYNIIANHLENSLPGNTLKEFQNEYYQSIAHFLVQKEIMEKILESCNEKGIRVIPLKGLFTSLQYYDEPGTRLCRDLDFLVMVDQCNEFNKIAHGLGFERLTSEDGHWSYSYRHRTLQNVKMEVHWKLWFNFRLKIPEKLIWDNGIPVLCAGVPCFSLNPVHEFVHACFHIASHHYFRGPLLWVNDIHLMVQHQKFSGNEFLREFREFLEEFQCKRIVRNVLAIVNRYFSPVNPVFLQKLRPGSAEKNFIDPLIQLIALHSTFFPGTWFRSKFDLRRILTSFLLLEKYQSFRYLLDYKQLNKRQKDS